MKTGLVITAHPGDFVWRAGGAIALHAKKGYRMKIVCLSFGERGDQPVQFPPFGGDTLLSLEDAGGRDPSVDLLMQLAAKRRQLAFLDAEPPHVRRSDRARAARTGYPCHSFPLLCCPRD